MHMIVGMQKRTEYLIDEKNNRACMSLNFAYSPGYLRTDPADIYITIFICKVSPYIIICLKGNLCFHAYVEQRKHIGHTRTSKVDMELRVKPNAKKKTGQCNAKT